MAGRSIPSLPEPPELFELAASYPEGDPNARQQPPCGRLGVLGEGLPRPALKGRPARPAKNVRSPVWQIRPLNMPITSRITVQVGAGARPANLASIIAGEGQDVFLAHQRAAALLSFQPDWRRDGEMDDRPCPPEDLMPDASGLRDYRGLSVMDTAEMRPSQRRPPPWPL
jgi:hypothetical protein